MPADVVYRVDFPNAHQDAGFAQLMQVAGWTLAATTMGWHYRCTRFTGGRAPELFSDNESKLRIFRNRLGMVAASAMPLFLVLLMADKQRALDRLSMPFLVPLCVALAPYVLILPYTILQLMLRIRKLNHPLPT